MDCWSCAIQAFYSSNSWVVANFDTFKLVVNLKLRVSLGGIIASNVAEMLGDYLTRTIFDLPKDVAAEKAYCYFGLSQSAPNNKINEVYRGLCLKYHPDKQGGDHQKFLELQSQMAIIKAHREEL